MTTSRVLLLLLAAFFMLGAAGDHPVASQCRDDLYMLPMPQVPHDDAMQIAFVPSVTNTYRLCYATSPGQLCNGGTFVPSSSGSSFTTDVRGEFDLTSLTGATKYYWRVECSEDGRWKNGWEGSFVTTPTTAGEVRLLVSTDNHFVVQWINDHPDYDHVRVQQFHRGVALIAREQDAHAHIDLGDGVYFQGKVNDGYVSTDHFGRKFGHGAIDSYATNEAEAIANGEARASLYMRRFWRAMRFMPFIVVRGNHDVGARYGDNGPGKTGGAGTGLISWRDRPWVETGITVTLPTDLGATGIFTVTGHGMSDDDGPYRWAPYNDETYFNMPTLAPGASGCTGVRSSDDWNNEWYIDWLSVNTFRLKVNDTDATGCDSTFSYGSGEWTLLRGTDSRYTTAQVRAKYMSNHNDVLAHGWGPAEKGIMGPIKLSDYAVVLHLDEYEYTPETWPTHVLPIDNRSDGPSGGWGLGPQQRTGALALLNDAGPGSVLGYADTEIIVVAMHHTLGGHDGGYPYGRGTALESDTRYVDNKANECTEDSGTYGPCQYPRIDDDFAHDGWQNIHDALDGFVTRSSGIALVIVGHDHQCSCGKKDGVYYCTMGELNGAAGGWITGEESIRRHDFDYDGKAAYHKSLGKYGYGSFPSGKQNPPYEWGTDLDGFHRLTMCPSAGADACASGKPEIQMEFIVNDDPVTPVPGIHGTTEFTVTIEGP